MTKIVESIVGAYQGARVFIRAGADGKTYISMDGVSEEIVLSPVQECRIEIRATDPERVFMYSLWRTRV